MRKLLIQNKDTLQVVDENGDTIFSMPLPPWGDVKDKIDVFGETCDDLTGVDFEKTLLEALRHRIRSNW